mmetsp:Transcript_21943/g.41157  ORF Transcript_21943/g.41157 Transcript_21943/m.41157 type:complete len:135 (+) Transcript_21943:1274-1678(+)
MKWELTKVGAPHIEEVAPGAAAAALDSVSAIVIVVVAVVGVVGRASHRWYDIVAELVMDSRNKLGLRNDMPVVADALGVAAAVDVVVAVAAAAYCRVLVPGRAQRKEFVDLHLPRVVADMNRPDLILIQSLDVC